MRGGPGLRVVPEPQHRSHGQRDEHRAAQGRGAHRAVDGHRFGGAEEAPPGSGSRSLVAAARVLPHSASRNAAIRNINIVSSRKAYNETHFGVHG
ncbi:hypothetical protein GCM10022205_50200 [Spinactinospora alkalitolerans]